MPRAVVLAAVDENRPLFGDTGPDSVRAFDLLRPDAAKPDAPTFEVIRPCFIATMVNSNSLAVTQKNHIPLLPDDRIEAIEFFTGVPMTSASGSLETFSSFCVMTLGAVWLLGSTRWSAMHRRHESDTSAADELVVVLLRMGSTGRTSRGWSAGAPKRLMTGVATSPSNIQRAYDIWTCRQAYSGSPRSASGNLQSCWSLNRDCSREPSAQQAEFFCI